MTDEKTEVVPVGGFPPSHCIDEAAEPVATEQALKAPPEDKAVKPGQVVTK